MGGRDGYGLPLALSVAAPLAAALIVLIFLAEPPRHPGAAARESYLEILGAGLLAVAALGRGWLAIAGLTLFAATAASAKVLLQARLQHAIEGHARATITSVVGPGQELVGLVLFLAIGAIATRSDWATSFVLLAAALVVVAAALAVGAGERKVGPERGSEV